MTNLILIKHAMPVLEPGKPPNQWILGEKGRGGAAAIAPKIAAYAPDRILTSEEPKAYQTGQIIAAVLNLPDATTQPGLHEHDRSSNAPYYDDPERFRQTVQRVLERPRELIYGTETANDAYMRFRGAVQACLAAYPGERLAIVAHGTVMSLLVSRANQIDPVGFWHDLPLPCFVVLNLPDFRQISTVIS